MPKVLWSRDSRFKLPLNSNEMQAHTPPDGVSIGNCKLIMNPLSGLSDACALDFYSDFGGGSIAAVTVDLNGFEITSGIQNISGDVSGQPVATWNDATSPVTGNEARTRLAFVGSANSPGGNSTGGCGRCFSSSASIDIDGTNTFLLNTNPPNPHQIRISQTHEVCINGDTRVESIWFSGFIAVGWHPNINGQSNTFDRWFDVTIQGLINLPVDADPLVAHTIPVTATYNQFDFHAAVSEARTPSDIATIPTDVTVSLASSA